MAVNIALFIIGLIVLIIASSWLIQGCVRFSSVFKLAPLFIGMVLVAFGTSAPESGTSIIAAIRNQKGIALGVIIGSNIANIGLSLGLCALLKPLNVNKIIFKREIPIMFLSVGLLYFLSWDLVLGRIDGLIFILFFIIFCIISYKGSKKSFDHAEIKDFKVHKLVGKLNSHSAILGLILVSTAGIVMGADLMVRGGAFVAKIIGISSWVIGITVFAVGTSLPELATSLTASFKKVSSIGVGNIIGSNIFNILFTLGVVSLIKPVAIAPSILKFELPVLAIFSAALFVIMRKGYKISRVEGLIMLLAYISFIILVIIR